MSYLHQIKEWSRQHSPKWLVVLRVALGLLLFVKGFSFIQNSTLLVSFVERSSIGSNAGWLVTVIPWLHLLGGTLIVIGLFTRLAALIQVPILLGAVFFVNARQGIFAGESDLLFSIIILILLLFFLIEGGGFLSLDHYREDSFEKTNT
ncbi:MAG: DoxX family protein [Ferruginibacter sp.]